MIKKGVMPLSMIKKITVKTRSISRSGKGAKKSSGGKTVELKNPVVAGDRKYAGPEQGSQEIEVVFHAPVGIMAAEVMKERTRSLPVVSEAMKILIASGYIPVRLSESPIPVNLIGLGGRAGTLLVYAVRSKVPVPSAAKLRKIYAGRVDRLRVLAGKVLHMVMIFVESPSCSWRYYLIYPGGLRYDHDFAASLK
jgi:hypothetical protein